MDNYRKTALYQEHLKLNAKIVPFAGWQMPLQYSGIIDEHNAVRNNVGIFDVSHMGEFFVSGKDSLNLLQMIVPQDISKLEIGKAVYCQLLNENAGIIDDLIIYRINDENENKKFLLIVNASRIDADFNWIEAQKNKLNMEVDFVNKSEDLSMIALQGNYSPEIINGLGLSTDNQPKKFTIKETKLSNINVYIARTGYTGEDGFEIIVNNENASIIWQKILESGEKYEIKPVGLGARDTLRLESAMLLYGQDITENTTPIEASLNWSIPKDKIENYTGKDILLNQMSKSNLNKTLIGFKMTDRAIPRHDYEIYLNNEKIGIVTSGGVSPTLSSNIGLGYIATDLGLDIGSTIDIKIRDKFYKAQIVKRPFYSRSKRS